MEMRALEVAAAGGPLQLTRRRVPEAGPGEVRLRVRACGVCRTDLHLLAGELEAARYPVVPGHQIVGEVESRGSGVELAVGTRVGVPWLGGTCGRCRFCTRERENLCDHAIFTGCNRDGGFAEYAVADARYCFPLPEAADAVSLAPLLCAGLIGHRCLRQAGDARTLGIYGFGAAAHIVAQVACYEGRRVFAFTRPGDVAAQRFARECGAVWAGDAGDSPPEPLEAAILFAPVGELVPTALRAVEKGGTVVCGGIHMSDVPSFPYEILWGERCVRSVANLTRRDAVEFLALAPRVPIRTRTEAFPLERGPDALARLERGEQSGAAVLVMD
jgi:propanol-preferring alcohol dehydrogenase